MIFHKSNIWLVNNPEITTLKMLLDIFPIVIVNKATIPLKIDDEILSQIWTTDNAIKEKIVSIVTMPTNRYDDLFKAWFFNSKADLYRSCKQSFTKEISF